MSKDETALVETAVIMPLLRNRRDYLWRAIELERAAPCLPWCDHPALIEAMIYECAILNAAIARRIPGH